MTTVEPPHEPRRRGFRTGRLEAFSDGVFAIAITLLVLDIGVSGGAGRHLLRSIVDLWPSYLAYLVSFATIGAAWLGHNAVTEYLDRADAAFVRLNLLLLLMVSFLPFPTRLVADYIGEDSPERVAVTFTASASCWPPRCCWCCGATRSGRTWCARTRPMRRSSC